MSWTIADPVPIGNDTAYSMGFSMFLSESPLWSDSAVNSSDQAHDSLEDIQPNSYLLHNPEALTVCFDSS